MKKLNYILFLQFIGPIFVILGHSTNGIPTNEYYYMFTKKWIYIFHMPLFFFISGYLYSYNKNKKEISYNLFIKKKFYRLIVPYIFWNLLFFIPKILFSKYIKDSVSFNLKFFKKLLLVPRANILGHTWFLMALFLLFLISPLIYRSLRTNGICIITTILLVIISCNPIKTGVFSLNDLSKNCLFFWIGMILGNLNKIEVVNFFKKKETFFYITLGFILMTIFSLNYYQVRILKVMACFFILMILFSIPIFFRVENKRIEIIAQNSFGIYILHWPVMLCIRILFYQVLKINNSVVILFMIVGGFIISNIVLYFTRKIRVKKIKKYLSYILGA